MHVTAATEQKFDDSEVAQALGNRRGEVQGRRASDGQPSRRMDKARRRTAFGTRVEKELRNFNVAGKSCGVEQRLLRLLLRGFCTCTTCERLANLVRVACSHGRMQLADSGRHENWRKRTEVEVSG